MKKFLAILLFVATILFADTTAVLVSSVGTGTCFSGVAIAGPYAFGMGSYNHILYKFLRDTVTGALTGPKSQVSTVYKGWAYMSTEQLANGKWMMYVYDTYPGTTVAWYVINATTGSPMLAGNLTGLSGGWIWSPDKSRFYVLSSTPQIFKKNVTTGALVLEKSFTSDGAGKFGLAFSPDGKFFYTRSGMSILVYSVNATDGTLAKIPGLTFTLNGCTPPSNDQGGMIISPDGRHIYVTVCGDGQMGCNYILERNGETGGVIEKSSELQSVKPYGGLVFNPDGHSGYYMGDATGYFLRDTASGQLTFVQDFGVKGSGPYDPYTGTFYVGFHHDDCSIKAFKTSPTYPRPVTSSVSTSQQVMPNAFGLSVSGSPGATVRLGVLVPSVAAGSTMSLKILDLQGRLARTLAHGPMGAGVHAIDFNGMGDNHQALAKGVYLCRLQTQGFDKTVKLVLTK